MKKGFTMIELVFVIVILGVLASVAIPRLSATRDDAEVAKAISNANIAIRDISTYYTANGDLDKISTMTSAIEDDGETHKEQYRGILKIKNKNCIEFFARYSTKNDVNDNAGKSIGLKWNVAIIQIMKFKNNDKVCGIVAEKIGAGTKRYIILGKNTESKVN